MTADREPAILRTEEWIHVLAEGATRWRRADPVAPEPRARLTLPALDRLPLGTPHFLRVGVDDGVYFGRLIGRAELDELAAGLRSAPTRGLASGTWVQAYRRPPVTRSGCRSRTRVRCSPPCSPATSRPG
jgi:hypothetical protein